MEIIKISQNYLASKNAKKLICMDQGRKVSSCRASTSRSLYSSSSHLLNPIPIKLDKINKMMQLNRKRCMRLKIKNKLMKTSFQRAKMMKLMQFKILINRHIWNLFILKIRNRYFKIKIRIMNYKMRLLRIRKVFFLGRWR